MEPAQQINRAIVPLKESAQDSKPVFESEYDKDTWDIRNLGFEPKPATGGRQLNFTRISQPWLRIAVKQYIRYTLATLSFGSAQARLSALKKFAIFLSQHHPLLQPTQINRTLIIEYLSYLRGCRLSSGSRSSLIGSLKSFLALAARYEWLAIESDPLIFREDYPRQKKYRLATFQ